MVIQILVSACSAFVVVKAWKNYRNKQVRLATAFVWSFFWIVMIIFVWQPQLTDRLAAVLQVGRGADAIFYLSSMFIFYLFFKVFVKIETLDQHLTTIIREIALLEKKK